MRGRDLLGQPAAMVILLGGRAPTQMRVGWPRSAVHAPWRVESCAYTESLTLRRRIRTTYGDTPESLRDLSVSLEKVAGIQQLRGQLDEALAAYTESLRWYTLLDERYGPPFADPDELSALQDAVASLSPEGSAR
jgi:hypothetical protein